jgi:hypothetical protein
MKRHVLPLTAPRPASGPIGDDLQAWWFLLTNTDLAEWARLFGLKAQCMKDPYSCPIF